MGQDDWLPIQGYEGIYQISTQGAIASLERYREGQNGTPTLVRARLLTPSTQENGYLTVTLSRDGKGKTFSLHVLVLETFVGPRPKHQVIRHLDGDKTNNTLANLRYGTPSENNFDTVRHGRGQVAKTHCPQGHEYAGRNLRIRERETGVSRGCRTCDAESSRRSRENK